MKTGFSYVARPDARVLILGSMPGTASLDAAQYYAHQRNAFWTIMERLFAIPSTEAYTTRLRLLTERGIALWDVIHRCRRPGSLDADIVRDSIMINDFPALFDYCPGIQHVFFNGQKARQLFIQHVTGRHPELTRDKSLCLLPSTSPAHAALSLEQKISAWSAIRDTLRKEKAVTP